MSVLKRVGILVISIAITSCASAPVNQTNENSWYSVLQRAEQGDPESVHAACYRYMYGKDGAPKDKLKALEWCEKASALGIPSSITLLAELHRDGNGVPKNLPRARFFMSWLPNLVIRTHSL